MSFPVPRLLSLLAALALVGAACGGGDGEAETGAAPADTGSADTDSGDAASDDDATTDAPADDAAQADAGSADADGSSWPHTFVADEIGGGQIDATDLAGQDVILWFWAPW